MPKTSVDLQTFIPNNINFHSPCTTFLSVFVRAICATEVLYFIPFHLSIIACSFIKIEIQVCYVNVYNSLYLFQSSNITLQKYHLWLEKMFSKC